MSPAVLLQEGGPRQPNEASAIDQPKGGGDTCTDAKGPPQKAGWAGTLWPESRKEGEGDDGPFHKLHIPLELVEGCKWNGHGAAPLNWGLQKSARSQRMREVPPNPARNQVKPFSLELHMEFIPNLIPPDFRPTNPFHQGRTRRYVTGEEEEEKPARFNYDELKPTGSAFSSSSNRLLLIKKTERTKLEETYPIGNFPAIDPNKRIWHHTDRMAVIGSIFLRLWCTP
ncbi:hypothetical protein R3P38DRAFT_2815652 [Favolaschia claudopus]|uniref:Uncharacterized protein n=1 Tax=Favolaschia claudopus TaxID=2862362 RepID=A0AAV9Z131_9AGAR